MLLDLAGSHYAAICIGKDRTAGGENLIFLRLNRLIRKLCLHFCIIVFAGEGALPMKCTVHRTIPYVEDECVSGTDLVVAIGGST